MAVWPACFKADCYNTPVKRIAGLGISSLLTEAAAAAEHLAPKMPGEYAIVAVGLATFLSHALTRVTDGQTDAVLAGFERSENHDLEFALAAAYREALKKLRTEDAGKHLSTGGLALIDRWIKLLDEVKTPKDASWVFARGDSVDPAKASAKPDVWGDIRKILVRWAEPATLTPALDAYLAEQLPGEIQAALERLVRDGPHGRGWIAWQQSFFKATYEEARHSNVKLEKVLSGIAEQNNLQWLLIAKVDEINRKLDQFLSALAAQRRVPEPADIAAYLTALWNSTGQIEIKNLRIADGSANSFNIDELYTPLTTVLPHEPRDISGMPGTERAAVPLQEALKEPRLVLVGDPGAGKTTFLRRIAFEACHALLGKETDRHVEPMLAGPPLFPVLIRAESLSKLLKAGDTKERLFHFLDGEYPDVGADHFRERFAKGCLLLLDGLDEVADEPARDRIVELLKGAAHACPHTRIVATSRPGVFGGVTSIHGFHSVHVAPLDRAAIAVFAGKWGRAVYPNDESAAAKLTRTLLSEVNAKKEIRALAVNPVMLTALACLHFTHAVLPEQRSELYWSVLEWLAKARAAKTGRDYNILLALLRKLAFAMHAGEQTKRTEIERGEAVELLAPEFQEEREKPRQRVAAERFLEAEEVNSGIIVSHGEKVRFWHLTFQEALAADALAYDPEERQRLLFDEDRVNDSQWRETVLLLAGELKKRGNDPVNKLLDKVLRSAEGANLLRQVRCAGLMGALLKDLAAWKYSLTEPLAARYHAILSRALSIFDAAQSGKIPLEARLEAAEALGQAGDPRLRVPKDKDYWVSIPGGKFVMGDGGDRAPKRSVDLDTFLIGRYPVTVYEYGLFLDHTEHKAPEDWEAQCGHSNRPVLNVSWFDAEAYCKWAGVRLATEAEWERAARGVEGRRYPWGNDPPSPALANYDGAGINHASPVGLFPRGSTPEGIADMTGNVLEWTSDWYDDGKEFRSLRGGSWYFDSTYLRAAYRDWLPPVGRDVNIGFRCVREVFP
jgi:formylglycine-generating enzyme required for sulfatase activity